MEFDDQLFPKIEISYEPETRQISNEHQTQNLNSAQKKGKLSKTQNWNSFMNTKPVRGIQHIV